MFKEFKKIEELKRGKKFKFFIMVIFVVFLFYTLLATALGGRYSLIAVSYAGLAGTKHDLSVYGPGPIRAQTETQKCIFCHTPHAALADSAGRPLWNRNLSSESYTVPIDATFPYLLSTVPQPNRGSKLCLGCHDGTVAIGSILHGGSVGMQATSLLTAQGYLSSASTALLGTDISWKHPVSIALNDTLIDAKVEQCNSENPSFFKVRYPTGGSPVKLVPTDAGSGVQCRSCHDPHNDPYDQYFLVVDYNANSNDLCLACHYCCNEEECVGWE